MQTVPKIVTSTHQFQNPETYKSEMQQMRTQMKTFMKNIKAQFSTIIGNYEQQISQLKMESTILKRSRNGSVTTASPYKKTTSFVIGQEDDFGESHILPLKTNQFYRTSESPFYRTERKPSSQFPSWGSAFQIRNTSPRRKITQKKQQNNFPEELITQEFDTDKSFQRSRYERQSERKRQHQEEIVHVLESHKKNLNIMTSQMMHLLGKTSKQQNQTQESSSQGQNDESQLKSHDDHHNRSLSQICDSLDHSFVSQKARKGKLKKKKAEEEAKKKREEMESLNEKIRKERALKNLLQRLRENANSTNPPEIVKASKLIPAGPRTSIVFKQQSPMPVKKSSKVMINPIPVNSVQGKIMESSPSIVEKRPASILKQSSNILTRSISGISAISFQD